MIFLLNYFVSTDKKKYASKSKPFFRNNYTWKFNYVSELVSVRKNTVTQIYQETEKKSFLYINYYFIFWIVIHKLHLYPSPFEKLLVNFFS